MEYYKGKHRQLTDTNLSTNVANAKEFPSSDMTSKIFVRLTNGKPFLIWGENKEPKPLNVPPTGMTEIVIVDPASGKEVLRKPLGAGFSEHFQPNQAGTRIYFIRRDTGEIFCLDRETQAINSFAKTGLQHFDGWNCAMVAAN